jgi:integrase
VSVAVRPWKTPGKFQIDIIFRKPDGERVRDQRIVEAKTKGMARRWGEAREGRLRAGTLVTGSDKTPVMLVKDFAPIWLERHCEASLHKRSGTDTSETILRCHLVPFIGGKRLDQVTDDVVAHLKARWLKGGYTAPSLDGKGKVTLGPTKSRKTFNNRASVLSSMLHTALRWRKETGLTAMPCLIELDKVDAQRAPQHYEHETYERLVEGARQVDARAYVLVLLAGDGGLRRGECVGLDLADIDFKAGRFTPIRSVYWRKGKSYEDVVKGDLAKPVPCTERLLEALMAVRHLRGPRVLYTDDCGELTPKIVRNWIEKAERKAGLPVTGRLHVLRHTFCSHAAMAGVPARTIQELARHASLAITMRYMHLSPSAKDEGIAMLAASRQAGGSVMAKGFTSGNKQPV